MDSPTILVVEDERVVAMDVESQLIQLGYDVTGIASTGEEALRLVQETLPDLILMDIQLHGSADGVTVAGQIRERWQIPVIFVTAYANNELVVRAKETGPYGYLTKPYTSKELNATVAVALEQHHLVREMFAEHGWLRTMLAGMNDGVIATDAVARVKYLNPIAENITGWKLAEASGQPIEKVYPLEGLDGKPLEMCQLRRVLHSGESIPRQRFNLMTRDGQKLTVEDSAAPIRDARGALAGAAAVIVDVTERQRIEQERDHLLKELARSNADLERFAYAIAHDLESPARTVKSFTELLSRNLKGKLSDENEECLKLVGSAAWNMRQLIQALLDYARAGHGVLSREEVRLADIVHSVRADLSGLIGDTGAKVVCRHLPDVYADPIQLKQVVQNLIVNAIHYRSPERPPEVIISGSITPDAWHITVADNGAVLLPSITTVSSTCSRASTEMRFREAASGWRFAVQLSSGMAAEFGRNRTVKGALFTSQSQEGSSSFVRNAKSLVRRKCACPATQPDLNGKQPNIGHKALVRHRLT